MTVPTLVKLRHLYREFGFMGSLWYLAARAVYRSKLGRIRQYVFLAQPITSDPSTPNRATTLTVQRVSEAEYCNDWFPRPEEVIRERFGQGAQCLVAFSKGTPAACLWLAFNSFLEDEARCRYLLSPKDTTAWDFDVFLHPEYRFGRTFARLWDAAERRLAADGRHWSLSRVNAFNPSSLRAHLRRGAIVVGKATFLTVGKAQILISGNSPYVHISLGANQMPRIIVRAPRNTPSHTTVEEALK